MSDLSDDHAAATESALARLSGRLHCRSCATRQQTQRLEVGLTDSGLVVLCKKHGLVGEFTPESLALLLAHPPECECCKDRRGLS